MGDATTLLFGLEGFRVVSVTREHEQDDRPDEKHDDGVREVVVEGVEDEQACRDCGVLSGAVHGRKMRRVKDLPHGRRPLRVWWDQRRWACRERACRRRTFTEPSGQVGARHGLGSSRQRLTRRLREQLEHAVSASTRPAADVARVYDVSWWSVNHALVVKAAGMTASAPAGVRMLWVDETRARSVRWLLAEHGRRRTDPWMASFVDLDPTTLGASSGWRLAGPVPASAGGWSCRRRCSGPGSRSWRSTRPRRSRQRCARRCRTRSWWWTTGTCTGSRT